MQPPGDASHASVPRCSSTAFAPPLTESASPAVWDRITPPSFYVGDDRGWPISAELPPGRIRARIAANGGCITPLRSPLPTSDLRVTAIRIPMTAVRLRLPLNQSACSSTASALQATDLASPTIDSARHHIGLASHSLASAHSPTPSPTSRKVWHAPRPVSSRSVRESGRGRSHLHHHHQRRWRPAAARPNEVGGPYEREVSSENRNGRAGAGFQPRASRRQPGLHRRRHAAGEPTGARRAARGAAAGRDPRGPRRHGAEAGVTANHAAGAPVAPGPGGQGRRARGARAGAEVRARPGASRATWRSAPRREAWPRRRRTGRS